MSTCRLNFVTKAQKDQGTCRVCHQPVTAGQGYKWWKGRYTPRYVAHTGCAVPLWMTETNVTRQEYMQAGDTVSDAQNADTPETAAELLRSAMESIESIKDQLQERVDAWQGTNLEYGAQSEACQSTISEFESWLDSAEDWASELEGLGECPPDPELSDFDPDDPAYEELQDAHEDWQQSFEQALQAIEDVPELDMGA